jgi:hypothetical protein
MATATKSKPKAVNQTFGCKFGNLNVGDEVCRIAVRIDRSKLKLADADKLLCSRRITCKLVFDNGGSGETPQLPGADDKLTVKGSFDTKSFGVNAKSIAAGLTANIKDIDLEELTKFAKREGRIEISGVVDIEPEDDPEE